jgi:hypothetical protein
LRQWALAKHVDLQRAMTGAKPMGTGLLLPSRRLQDADLRDLVLFGYDGIWFFPSDKITPKPDSAWIVGPKRVDQTQRAGW